MAATKPREILLSELLTLHLDLAIKRFKDVDMDKRAPLKIPMPLELAGMRSRLLRAQQQEKDITKTGQAYDAVMDRIDELHEAHKDHVWGLEAVESTLRATIMRMTERPNSDPSDGESDGRRSSSEQGEQVEKPEQGGDPEKKEAAGNESSSGSFQQTGNGAVSS